MDPNVITTAVLSVLSGITTPLAAQDAEVRDIGSRRELFVDDYLIGRLDGARLELHHPQRAEKVLVMDQPWDEILGGYLTVFQDGERYRMYYMGQAPGLGYDVICYAESPDGIQWTKPHLGLVEVAGTRDNNVILARLPECHNLTPFLDTNPAAPPTERYKALGGTAPVGLLAYGSEDGLHWHKMQEEAVITQGAFDSQNLAFWSPSEGCYVCYFRFFDQGFRAIRRCTSQDFRNWTEPVDMTYGDAPREHLYTNATPPYFRAPHIYVALPSRFIDGQDAVTPAQKRALGVWEGYLPPGTGFNDVPLMTSRGGSTYQRTFLEAFIRPGLGLQNWTSRATYPAAGIVPTGETEMSLYVQREIGYKSDHIRRYVLRYDGFISVNAPYAGGELWTRPLLFRGDNSPVLPPPPPKAEGPAGGEVQLFVNYSTSAVGRIRGEICDDAGQPLPGFTLDESDPLIGDEIDRVVSWGGRTELKDLVGRPVRLHFQMKDADLYSLQFR